LAITINEIAKQCGVSRGTVDRVLNGRTGVSRATIEKVSDFARLHNYQPNVLGQALAKSGTLPAKKIRVQLTPESKIHARICAGMESLSSGFTLEFVDSEEPPPGIAATLCLDLNANTSSNSLTLSPSFDLEIAKAVARLFKRIYEPGDSIMILSEAEELSGCAAELSSLYQIIGPLQMNGDDFLSYQILEEHLTLDEKPRVLLTSSGSLDGIQAAIQDTETKTQLVVTQNSETGRSLLHAGEIQAIVGVNWEEEGRRMLAKLALLLSTGDPFQETFVATAELLL
jgi:transcriptional regulator with XRE-family HTH domain